MHQAATRDGVPRADPGKFAPAPGATIRRMRRGGFPAALGFSAAARIPLPLRVFAAAVWFPITRLLAASLFATLLLAPSLSAAEMARARVRVAGHEFIVDIADTPALQSRGLGGRRTLGPREGMLFLYALRGRPSFWMYGMVIPIDIIWLDNTRIVHIEHRVPPPAPGTPRSRLPTYQPQRPANAVLEIAAGLAAKLGLRVGSRVDINFDVQ